ncbi:ribbon-helix-helix protein, CopG family [Streptomyces sp. bgisy100]|uniref:ribbon-helix-helix protein, CopG family n=1 Tax=Streptomyces sp. bgisy100 TaxID=3413783 RepID=UPI003D74932E
MATRMLSVRIDSETLASVKERAHALDMTVQEYVVRTLQRDEFTDRFMTAANAAIDVYYDALAEVDTGPEAGAARGTTDETEPV